MVIEKEELMHFAAVCFEHTWMTRNKLQQQEKINSWDIIGKHIVRLHTTGD